MTHAIEAVDLCRSYSSTRWFRRGEEVVHAVRGVSFHVRPGELFGLLGPNGAGKTTTIKMLNTLLLPTGGTARVLGHDVAADPVAVRRRIGYVFGGDRGLYDRLSALDNLRYFAELYGVEPRSQRERIGEVLDAVGLLGRERERVDGYSRGMRQRLHIARGLLHRPAVLFLDEPSIGVDPVAARELRRVVRELSDAGTTILLTTHYMAEADELCDRVAIIDGGTIRVCATPAVLKETVAERRLLVVEARGVDVATQASLRRLGGVTDVGIEQADGWQTLTVRHDGRPGLHSAVAQALRSADVRTLVNREPTLEDAYVSVVRGPGARSELAA